MSVMEDRTARSMSLDRDSPSTDEETRSRALDLSSSQVSSQITSSPCEVKPVEKARVAPSAVASASEDDQCVARIDRYDESVPESTAVHTSEGEETAKHTLLTSTPTSSEAPPAEDMEGCLSCAPATRHERPCCICQRPAAPYTCPRCARFTCSISCIRVHKMNYDCCGTRDVTMPVSLHQYNDAQLQRDFHFLEDCHRVVDNAARHFPHQAERRIHHRALPPSLAALREAARRRGVVCQFISSGMHRRRVNTSYYDRARDTIMWYCEFRFHTHQTNASAAHAQVSLCGSQAALDAPVKNDISVDVRHDPPTEANADVTDPFFVMSQRYVDERRCLDEVLRRCGEAETAVPWQRRGHRRLPHPPAGHLNRLNEDIRTPCVKSTEDGEDGVSDRLVRQQTTERAEAELTAVSATTSAHTVENETDHVAAARDTNATRISADALQTVNGEEVDDGQRASLLPPSTPRDDRVCRFFAHAQETGDEVVVLARAERIAHAQPKYIVLDCHASLQDNLRTLFFISEYPVFDVMYRSALWRYPRATEADVEVLRQSLRRPPSRKPHDEHDDVRVGEGGAAAEQTTTTQEDSTNAVGGEEGVWGRKRWGSRPPPMCRAHRAGRCTRGTACRFAHTARHEPVRAEEHRPAAPFSRAGRGGGVTAQNAEGAEGVHDTACDPTAL